MVPSRVESRVEPMVELKAVSLDVLLVELTVALKDH